MTLAELIQRFRSDAFDLVEPYLFDERDIIHWLNDAEKEAAIRGRLIFDSTTPEVCVIDMVVGEEKYPLHNALYEITDARYVEDVNNTRCYEKLFQISEGDIEDELSCNRYNTDYPEWLIQHDTYIKLWPIPKRPGSIVKLKGYRTPLKPMVEPTDRPEINQIHHEMLIQWALHKGFSRPDSEVFEPSKAAEAEYKFTDYFGMRPNSDLRRKTREDLPHTVTPFWV